MPKGAHFAEYEVCPKLKKDGTPCSGRVFPPRKTCAFHDPEVIRKGHRARDKAGAARKYPDIVVVPKDETDDYVIDNLQNVISAAKGRQDTDETARLITAALGTLDRALERRANRGTDVTRIEVRYVHDWRKEKSNRQAR